MTTQAALSLVIDGLANEQATTIVVESDLFDSLRTRVYNKLPPPWDHVLQCRLCTGTWIALAQALYGQLSGRDNRTPVSALLGPGHVGRLVRDGLAIACAGRLIHLPLGREL